MTLQEFTAAGTEVIVSAEDPAREVSRSRGFQEYLLILFLPRLTYLPSPYTSTPLALLHLTLPNTHSDYPVMNKLAVAYYCP